MSATPRAMPRRLHAVYAEIMGHPRFKMLPDATRFDFAVARGGYAHTHKKARQDWTRQLWRHLYWDEALSPIQ